MDNNNFFNNSFNAYDSNGFNSQILSNIVRVVSLEDAIMRTPNRPCDMVYFNQDKDEFYRVKVDLYGKKVWGTFPFVTPSQSDTTPVTRAEYNELVAKVDSLLKGGVLNVELDGQNVQQ